MPTLLVPVARPNLKPTNLCVEIITLDQHQLGKDRPVAFILPGGPGADHKTYLNYSCLAEVVDLVFHDPRGCGNSEKGERSTYCMDNYIDDVEAIRQYLALDKIIVIGKSYGAMCALGFTLRYPSVVEKLVLAAGTPSYRFINKAKKNIATIGTAEQKKICDKLWAGNFNSREELLEFFILTNMLYSVKARTKALDIDNLAKKSERFSYEVLNEGFRNHYWHFDFEKELTQVHCPTLVLAGRQDWITDVEFSELMAEKIPNSRIMIFENASHAMEADVDVEYFQTIS